MPRKMKLSRSVDHEQCERDIGRLEQELRQKKQLLRDNEDEFNNLRDNSKVIDRLKAAEEEIENLKAEADEVRAEMLKVKKITNDEFTDIDQIEDLAETYMRQAARIAELENLLAIDGLRLTQAWRQISELKRATHAAQV